MSRWSHARTAWTAACASAVVAALCLVVDVRTEVALVLVVASALLVGCYGARGRPEGH